MTGSERKTVNKHFPIDYDPSKIPKLHLPRNRQMNIRTMAPCNMRCDLCSEYIYQGRKFNSRVEMVENERYLGLRIYRFYIRCPRCINEIIWKTDPENDEYKLIHGATRNFESLRKMILAERKKIKDEEEEAANNPMKMLENRTKSSRTEMDTVDALEEIQEINADHAKVSHEELLKRHAKFQECFEKLQEEEDNKLINKLYGRTASGDSIKRIVDDDDGSGGSGSDREDPGGGGDSDGPSPDPLTSSSSGSGTTRGGSKKAKRRSSTHEETEAAANISSSSSLPTSTSDDMDMTNSSTSASPAVAAAAAGGFVSMAAHSASTVLSSLSNSSNSANKSFQPPPKKKLNLASFVKVKSSKALPSGSGNNNGTDTNSSQSHSSSKQLSVAAAISEFDVSTSKKGDVTSGSLVVVESNQARIATTEGNELESSNSSAGTCTDSSHQEPKKGPCAPGGLSSLLGDYGGGSSSSDSGGSDNE